MELWAYPYLFYYLAMFAFWMLAMHRQILFWLYLWQLKEYYPGRLLAHFENSKRQTAILKSFVFYQDCRRCFWRRLLFLGRKKANTI